MYSIKRPVLANNFNAPRWGDSFKEPMRNTETGHYRSNLPRLGQHPIKIEGFSFKGQEGHRDNYTAG